MTLLDISISYIEQKYDPIDGSWGIEKFLTGPDFIDASAEKFRDFIANYPSRRKASITEESEMKSGVTHFYVSVPNRRAGLVLRTDIEDWAKEMSET